MVTKEILKQHGFVEITNDFWQYSNNGVYGKGSIWLDEWKVMKDRHSAIYKFQSKTVIGGHLLEDLTPGEEYKIFNLGFKYKTPYLYCNGKKIWISYTTLKRYFKFKKR